MNNLIKHIQHLMTKLCGLDNEIIAKCSKTVQRQFRHLAFNAIIVAVAVAVSLSIGVGVLTASPYKALAVFLPVLLITYMIERNIISSLHSSFAQLASRLLFSFAVLGLHLLSFSVSYFYQDAIELDRQAFLHRQQINLDSNHQQQASLRIEIDQQRIEMGILQDEYQAYKQRWYTGEASGTAGSLIEGNGWRAKQGKKMTEEYYESYIAPGLGLLKQEEGELQQQLEETRQEYFTMKNKQYSSSSVGNWELLLLLLKVILQAPMIALIWFSIIAAMVASIDLSVFMYRHSMEFSEYLKLYYHELAQKQSSQFQQAENEWATTSLLQQLESQHQQETSRSQHFLKQTSHKLDHYIETMNVRLNALMQVEEKEIQVEQQLKGDTLIQGRNIIKHTRQQLNEELNTADQTPKAPSTPFHQS